MSRPEDIPADVWAKAEAVGESIHGRHERGWVAWPLCSHDPMPAQEIIARAIMAAKAEEREACAKLADEERLNPFNSGGMDTAFREIAKAIRKRGEA